ncbi:hypothetical protein UK23_19250 [Lentzea aerocolonigenes]|uniref:Uncharacterized protein n=1 Tax=Lentzea aerocolonigenes TaxID=68170 RepID=A0A0F0H2A1_LENAE|nr:hypothetical protein [Lentzea aerocolonigenes]KJK47778.1 hypothetical protein UK23_19250 [Lentzea aerocolonigenes]
MVPEWYRDKPLVNGAELLPEPLFWLNHLAGCMPDGVQEMAFGADWEDAEEFYLERMASHDEWPVITAELSDGNAIHVVYRNLDGDMGVDYLFSTPSWSEELTLAEGSFKGPGLAWHELERLPEHLLLLFPMLGDLSVPDHAVDLVAAALAEVGAPRELAIALLEQQGMAGQAEWRERDGVWICESDYSPRCPYNEHALAPERLAAVSAALN